MGSPQALQAPNHKSLKEKSPSCRTDTPPSSKRRTICLLGAGDDYDSEMQGAGDHERLRYGSGMLLLLLYPRGNDKDIGTRQPSGSLYSTCVPGSSYFVTGGPNSTLVVRLWNGSGYCVCGPFHCPTMFSPDGDCSFQMLLKNVALSRTIHSFENAALVNLGSSLSDLYKPTRASTFHAALKYLIPDGPENPGLFENNTHFREFCVRSVTSEFERALPDLYQTNASDGTSVFLAALKYLRPLEWLEKVSSIWALFVRIGRLICYLEIAIIEIDSVFG